MRPVLPNANIHQSCLLRFRDYIQIPIVCHRLVISRGPGADCTACALDYGGMFWQHLLLMGTDPAAQASNTPAEGCPGTSSLGRQVDLGAFTQLHWDGRQLILSWFRRAEVELTTETDEPFEPFIFAWFAYNGWAACCTGIDQDRDQCRAMASSADLSLTFQNLLKDDGNFKRHATRFRNMWPIFRAQELRRAHIQQQVPKRREQVARYLSADRHIRHEPSCYEGHRARNEVLPVDWPHTLLAIYQVRCNLFHGEKAAHSEMDRRIVGAALQTLIPFVGVCLQA